MQKNAKMKCIPCILFLSKNKLLKNKIYDKAFKEAERTMNLKKKKKKDRTT